MSATALESDRPLIYWVLKVFFLASEAAESCSWPITFTSCWDYGCMEPNPTSPVTMVRCVCTGVTWLILTPSSIPPSISFTSPDIVLLLTSHAKLQNYIQDDYLRNCIRTSCSCLRLRTVMINCAMRICH